MNKIIALTWLYAKFLQYTWARLYTLYSVFWFTWLWARAPCVNYRRFTVGFHTPSLEATSFWPQSLCFSIITYLGAQGGDCQCDGVRKKSSYGSLSLLPSCHQSWSCQKKWNEQKTERTVCIKMRQFSGELKDSSHLKNMNGS